MIAIKNRFTGAVLRTVEAVSLRGANLRGAGLGGAYLYGANFSGADLGGADLGGANLRGAYLGGAYLGGAYLGDADFGGADLGGAKIGEHVLARLVSRAWRVRDPYEFFCFSTEAGPLLIRAGCQTRTVESYREHVDQDYPGTPKAAETLAILDHFERVAKLS